MHQGHEKGLKPGIAEHLPGHTETLAPEAKKNPKSCGFQVEFLELCVKVRPNLSFLDMLGDKRSYIQIINKNSCGNYLIQV